MLCVSQFTKKLHKIMLKKYIVTIMWNETKIQIVLKSKLTKKQLYDVLCKMYDEFYLCNIVEYDCKYINFAYIISTHEQLKIKCF